MTRTITARFAQYARTLARGKASLFKWLEKAKKVCPVFFFQLKEMDMPEG